MTHSSEHRKAQEAESVAKIAEIQAELEALTVDDLRVEINAVDEQLLALIRRRVAISKNVGKVRMAAGGPRIIPNRENDILDRYSEFGADGRAIAMALLNLGRGRLGR